MKLTRTLSDEERLRLYDATRATLRVWIDRLREDVKGGFPEKVTAFREGMAVHGRTKVLRYTPAKTALADALETSNQCM